MLCIVCQNNSPVDHPAFCDRCWTDILSEEKALLRAADACAKGLQLSIEGSVAYQLRVRRWIASQPTPQAFKPLTIEDLDL